MKVTWITYLVYIMYSTRYNSIDRIRLRIPGNISILHEQNVISLAACLTTARTTKMNSQYTHIWCPDSADCSLRRLLDCYRYTCKSQLCFESRFAILSSDYWLWYPSLDYDTTDCPVDIKCRDDYIYIYIYIYIILYLYMYYIYIYIYVWKFIYTWKYE